MRLRGTGIRGRRARREGFALVLVLLLVVILTMTVAAFSLRTAGGYRLARSRAASWRMHFAALSAIEEAKAGLWRESMAAKETPGILAAPEPLETEIDGVAVRVEFVDEAGKFPVNALASAEEGEQKELALDLARLFDLLRLPNSTSLAQAVKDYVDPDSQGTREGRAANAPIFHVSELMRAQGFDSAVLYAPHREHAPPAADLLSAWHTGKVNVNAAPIWLLLALEPSLTDSDARAIIAAREVKPFSAPDDLATRSGLSAEGAALLANKTSLTTDTLALRVEARYGSFVKRMEAVVWVESSAAHTLFLRDGWESRGAM